MEPNNIEGQFRDQLNQREIKPSENAWDRLDAMLTVAEKPKRTYGWLYIAASFLGFLLIATVFFSQTEEAIDVPINGIVNGNVPVQKEGQKLNLPSATEKEKAGLVKQTNTALAAGVQQQKNNQSSIKTITKEALPVIESKNNQDQNQIAENTIIDQKTEQKQQIAQKPAYIDVDELLASVEKPGKKEKLFVNKSEVRVNPHTLLSQVDGELDLTTREKAFYAFNKSFHTVQMAVSNRNKE